MIMKYTTFTVWVALIINEPIVIWIRLRFALDRKQVCASYRYESEHFVASSTILAQATSLRWDQLIIISTITIWKHKPTTSCLQWTQESGFLCEFLSNNELASASTDSTPYGTSRTTCQGHTNEKNFVGLTMNSEYLACGSETNEVYVYHTEITRPVTSHRFGTPEMDDAEEEAGSYFISAVCWKSDSPTMLTANSQGTIKVLVLAA
ncbi:unnamed protein product [Brassica oleracea var. botrytis]|uniref:(rape) hypothetical protein n=1 Tax=Brassica napus TaxID=3708 RepID=A0A816K648_BRANA|nr:unnamed protein product [Brassica napus]